MLDVPVFVMLPLASGLLATGRTRTFCHVSEFVAAELVLLATVKVIWFVVLEVTAVEVPVDTLLML
jgi:hypothetical protein